jgi:hypothetical protein
MSYYHIESNWWGLDVSTFPVEEIRAPGEKSTTFGRALTDFFTWVCIENETMNSEVLNQLMLWWLRMPGLEVEKKYGVPV